MIQKKKKQNKDRVSLYSSGWPQPSDLPALTTLVLEFWGCLKNTRERDSSKYESEGVNAEYSGNDKDSENKMLKNDKRFLWKGQLKYQELKKSNSKHQ